MKKELSEMTLEELWTLFPISLVAHDDSWESDYCEAEAALKKALSDYEIARISHVGSTAIHGIWAKNIIDILLEIVPGENMQAVAETAEKSGFLRMSAEPERISLNRGYTPEGFAGKVYHLHLRYEGDHDELYFRDYLNDHPDIAKAYERMKLDLWKQYEHDRDGYTTAKTDFIRKYTDEAKKQYGGRYELSETNE